MSFLGDLFWKPPPSASESSRGEFWGAFWRLLGPLFVISDKEFVQYAKKCSFGLFLGAKSKDLHLQNLANRTVHPSKIKDALSMVYDFRNVS